MATSVLKCLLCPRHLMMYQTKHFIHTQRAPLLFHVSNVLCAEPLRKQKKQTVFLEKAKKRMRLNLEKRKKLLSKFDAIEKPVEEIHIPLKFIAECKGFRKRQPVELSEDEIKNRNEILLEFFKLRCKSRTHELQTMRQLAHYQNLALQELRRESEDLYQSAIQLDEVSLPFQFTGPTETPPIQNYETPDGDYEDISRKF